MNRLKRHRMNPAAYLFLIFLALCLPLSRQSEAATMQDYCVVPPFIAQSVPPLVMFETGRDHKLYYEAYNDASDLDEDGKLDIAYKHSIDYYGYFDPNKCYTYSSTGSGEFNPVSVTSTKFCNAGQWSGNVLNWLNMSRMDSLKKVLYGGHRITDSNTKTVLERDIMPGDAHSWGKELTGRLCFNGASATAPYTYACKRDSDCESGYTCVDKSVNLIGIAAATAPFDCSATGAVTWSGTNKVRVARYYHGAALSNDIQCGTDSVGSDPVVARANFLTSFQPEVAGNFIDQFLATDFNDARLDPANDHFNNYNIVAVAEFNVASGDKSKNWQFFIDSDDPAEVEIGVVGSGFSGGSVVASDYGCQSKCATAPATACDPNQQGTYKPGSSGYHRVIVRQSERTGQDGVKLWYRKSSSDAWQIFPTGLTTRTPDITAASECTIKSNQYIALGQPQRGTPGGQHLFCGTSLAANVPPILRMITDNTHRKWEWASKENPVCLTTFNDGTSTGTITDYTVRVEVCKSSVGLESNCKNYSGTYKPVGLLQKYGEGDGSKVCSKVYTKSCNSDADCDIPTEGMCVDKSSMFFGYMTTSYTKNTSGGVLRKNFGSITDETNLNNGTFQTSENVSGNIIMTFDRLSPTVGFDFGAHTYTAADGGTCGWITNGPISEGQCRMWGNPIAEMMYESLRYIVGKGAPTADFTYSGSQDAGLSISKPDWGFNKGSTWYQPYGLYPACARPFMLVLSDVNTSFDNDQLPGAYNSSFTEDGAAPQLNMNVSTLADIIGTTEGIAGKNWFIGHSSGTTDDYICTSKAVSNLSQIDGICPLEPTKKGSYYAAAVSYYAKTKMNTNTGRPNADTFVVALDSPLANLKVKVGSNFINILPFGKSVSGGASVRTNCANRCTLTTDANGLHINNCAASTASNPTFCPTNQVVDVYVDDIRYDNSNSVIYANYRINFEDVEQGADHDMDAIVQYEICTVDAYTNGYGSCGTLPGPNQVEVKVNNVYGKGGIDQVLGFIISGTTADGPYLVVKDGDVSAADSDTPAEVAGLPLSFSKTFKTTGIPTGVLKDPLWYAAKWGGFTDIDGDGKAYAGSSCGTATPDVLCKEWDKDGDGTPDNYFLVANPLKLEDQLNKALLAILTRAASGTAASVLASSEGRGANIVQALFHPKKIFDNDTAVDWAGQLHNLWYYIDPRLQTNTIREDTVQDGIERLTDDWQVMFRFDADLNKTVADRYADTNGNGTPDTFQGTVETDTIKSLWEAGDKLFRRKDPRNIKTTLLTTSPGTLMDFSTANAAALAPYLQAATANEAKNIIEYIHGIDKEFCTGTTTSCTSDADCGGAAGSCIKYRSRTVTKGATSGVWKLGDIVTSTPKVQSPVNLNNYYTIYKDATYRDYTGSSAYRNYGTAYAGANDGMLHAFNFGVFEESWTGQDRRFEPARITAATADDFGKERWAFIPKNILPYLKYLTKEDYCHIYSVDASPVIFDAAINAPAGCTGNYWNCTKTQDSWRTVLIGSLRLGGACRGTTTVCADVNGDGQKDCVNTPVDVSGQSVGYSSYFALDITEQDNPQLLWEFSSPDLGYSTAGPAFLRIASREPNPADPATTEPSDTTNGRWFVVLASGPTGPINTLSRQFEARSDQNLKLFVLDLKTGQPARATIDTGIQQAFAGSLLGGKVDFDIDYQDDVLYFGYTKKCSATNNFCTANTWTDGGVLRLVTKEDLSGNDSSATGNTAINAANWQWSTVMSGIGPVNSAVANLVNRSNNGIPKEGWIYFGTGRYAYRDDDFANQRMLFGAQEPCVYSDLSGSGFHQDCTAQRAFCATPVSGAGPVSCGDLYNVTTYVQTDPSVLELKKGWYLNLESPTNTNVDGTLAANSNIMATAARVITDPVAIPNGAVFFTTFAPSPDVCTFGGNTFLWCLQYNNGGSCSLKGSALLQLSTGEIKEIALEDAFKKKAPVPPVPPVPPPPGPPVPPKGGRETDPMVGVPPIGQGLSLVISPTPIDRIIHIQKK